MKKITLLFKCALHFIVLCIALSGTSAGAQVVYQHNFGILPITGHPYNVPATTLSPGLSGSSWTNSLSEWTSFAGASGVAIALQNSSGTPTITLTFNVTPGNQLDIASFSFWRQRSNTGAQNWSMTINGIAAGNGAVPNPGATTGTLAVANPVTGLTGAVTVVLSLNGASGNGTFRLDDFTLNGTVSSSCTAPVVTSISPASGPPNTIVTITGSGFEAGSGTSSVKFNGVDAAGFTVVSDDIIKAIVPATGTTGAIAVTTDGCSGNSSSFTVLSSDCPIVVLPSDIYISEVYDQRTGSGGMIELYNPTNATITFNGEYVLQRYGNILDLTPTPGYILTLTGSIAPGATYLVGGNAPNNAICNTPPFDITYVSGFNANDKFELLKNDVVIDVVHVPFLLDGYTLIRKPSAIAPLPVYNVLDWNNTQHDTTVPNNYCANLGMHEADDLIPPTTISAQPISLSVCENDTAAFTVLMTDLTGYSFQWKVLNESGVWEDLSDDENYSGTNSNILTITDIPLEFLGNQYYCEMVNGSCTLVSNAVQLTVSPLPIVLPIPTNPTCFISTGSIIITPLLGTGLTYSIDGVNFQAGATFTNLAPGTYTITAQTLGGCQAEYIVEIEDIPLIPALPTIVVTQPTCTTSTGSIEITGPLGADLLYSINGTDFQAGVTFTGLAPGTYELTVQTLAGCESTLPVIINDIPLVPIVAATTATQPTCTTPTGTITVTAPVGAGFTYSINGTDFQPETTFTGLTPGTYNVTVENAEGCTSESADIVINSSPDAPETAVTTIVQPACGASTGSITVTAPLGTGLTYSINGTDFQSDTVFAGLAPGTYNVTVENGDGCTSESTDIVINNAPTVPAVAITTITQPTCTTPTGTVTVTAPTGAGFTYSINGTDFQPETVFTGLVPGTYNVTVENGDGCTSESADIVINNAPAVPVVATTAITQPTCTNSTGSITVTAPTGAGLTYSINGTDFQPETVFTGLIPGIYNVTVENGDGCTSESADIVINNAPAVPVIATTTIIQPTCTNSTGSITVTAPTGAGLTYSINGTDFQAETVFAGLAPGTYNVTVENADGCTSVSSDVVIDAVPTDPIEVTVTTVQPDCTTITGTINIAAPAGSDLTYSLDGTNFQTEPSFGGLAPGNYTLTTKNSDGCTSIIENIIIDAADVPAVATTIITQPTCSAISTGMITVTAPLGTAYTYSSNGIDFQSETIFSNLPAGTYNITVRNEAGCTSTTPDIVINAAQPVPVIATTTVTQPTCGIPSGTITVTDPTGAGLTYSIDGITFQPETVFAGLAPGTYNVTVQNAVGCTSISDDITINAVPGAPAVATTTITQPSCETPSGTITVTAPLGTGFTYSVDGTNFQDGISFAGLAPGTYTITTSNSGCTSTTPSITINAIPANPDVATATITQPTCASPDGTIVITSPTGTGLSYSIDGTTFQDGTSFTGVAPGTYTITVQNAGGCTSQSAAITVIDPGVPSTADVVITQPTCITTTGSITINTPTGTGFTYSIDGVNYQAGTSFSGLEPGTYSITVQSPQGCTSAPVDAVINEIPVAPAAATISAVQPTCDVQSGTITISGPTGAGLTYSINGTDFQDNTSFTDVVPGNYTLTVQNESGCVSDGVNIVIEAVPDFCDIPKGISPNNDGLNDSFDLSSFQVSKLNIYNRYGQEVYARNSYTNEWIGQTNKGDELPTGTYYYVIEGSTGAKTGWVYINREEN